MRYKINTLVVKNIPSLGKDVAEIEAVDMAGKVVKGSMWSDFPSYETMTFGSEFEADMVAKEKNGYVSYTFYAPRQKPTGGASKGFGGGMGAKLMEKKAEGIAHAQDRKEESIQKSGAQRDAVLIVTTFYKDSILTDAEIQQKIREWFRYFVGLQDEPFI